MSVVREGDRVSLVYVVREDSGALVDSSEGRTVELVAGDRTVVPGVARGLIGMAVGEKRSLRLTADEAYGRSGASHSRRLKRSALPPNTAIGDPIRLSMGTLSACLWVVELSATEVVVSLDHPLAGRDLVFELLIAEVTPGEQSGTASEPA